MSKKKTQAETPEPKEPKNVINVITIKDLAGEFGLSPAVVRRILRKEGLKPKETGGEGFGPRTKYQFEEGSEELERALQILEAYISENNEEE